MAARLGDTKVGPDLTASIHPLLNSSYWDTQQTSKAIPGTAWSCKQCVKRSRYKTAIWTSDGSKCLPTTGKREWTASVQSCGTSLFGAAVNLNPFNLSFKSLCQDSLNWQQSARISVFRIKRLGSLSACCNIRESWSLLPGDSLLMITRMAVLGGGHQACCNRSRSAGTGKSQELSTVRSGSRYCGHRYSIFFLPKHKCSW